MKNILFIGLLLIAFTSCEDKETSYEIDDEIIRNYLIENNINATKHEAGFYYVIDVEGEGQHPTIYDNIVVNYKGYYTDNKVFDKGTNIDFALRNLYRGWQYGLPLFGKGGKGKLFLPRHLAKNTTVMIFDIELINVWRP